MCSDGRAWVEEDDRGSEDQMMRYLGRLRRMDETRLTKKMYEVSIAEDLPWWKEMKQVLRKYVDEEEVDEYTAFQT